MRGYPTVYLMLGLWVPICLVAFARLRAPQALLFAFLGGILLLPERRAFEFSGLPTLGKLEISSLGALLGSVLFRSRDLARARLGTGIEVVVLLSIPFCLATALTNRDPTGGIYYWYPGLRPYDALGLIFSDLVLLGAPFVLGRAFFRGPAALRLLFRGLLAAGLGYALLALWEARMSPVLNINVYGYLQHSFGQTRRFDGWRPMVFMAHGLALSLFMCASMLLAIGAYRARLRLRGNLLGGLAAFFAFVLVACRSLGSLVYGVALAPLLLWARPRTIALVASALAALVIAYPLLRATNVFPTESLVEAARSVNEDRAGSLETRFRNEDGMLDRTRSRIWFGWGGFGRSRYDEDSPIPFVADGYWILRLSKQGLAGLGLYFVLSLFPIFQAARAIRRCESRQDAALLAALSVVLAMQVVDTLPNGLFNHLPLLLAGALSGLAMTVPRRGRATRKTIPTKAADRGTNRSTPSPAEPAPARTGTAVELAKGKARPGTSRRSR